MSDVAPNAALAFSKEMERLREDFIDS